MQNKKMLEDIQNVISDDIMARQVIEDFKSTFEQLGVSENSTATLIFNILGSIRDADYIEKTEREIRKMFINQKVCGKNLFETIQCGLDRRVEIIFEQVNPHLAGLEKVIDYGCGNGRLAKMLKESSNCEIIGVDVRDHLQRTNAIKFMLLDGCSVPVANRHFECGVLTNVLHHELENEKILKELNRIVSKKLVIIETVPNGDNVEEDWGRMFANDVLWNRFFNCANIPVPGTFDTPSNWIRRFEKYKWGCIHSENLGFDQPTIRDKHHLLVFEKK